MIIDGFINLVYAFVFLISLPFRVTPIVTLPNDWLSSIGTASTFIIPLDTFIPVATLLGIFFIFIVYEVAYGSWKFINWIIRKIPTIS